MAPIKSEALQTVGQQDFMMAAFRKITLTIRLRKGVHVAIHV